MTALAIVRRRVALARRLPDRWRSALLALLALRSRRSLLAIGARPSAARSTDA